MDPEDVTLPKQLLVEGKDPKALLETLINFMKIPDIQVQNFGGIPELTNFLIALTKNSNFRRICTSVGIARDAELDSGAAFQSTCTSLSSVGLTPPPKPIIASNSNPKTSIFIFPDEKTPGMIETLLLRAVATDTAIPCVDQFMDCVAQTSHYIPDPLDKARALAFMASRTNIKPLIGHAAKAGYWNFANPTYDKLKGFLRAL